MSGYTLTLDDYREFPASQLFKPDEHQTYTYDELDRLKTASKTFADGYTAVYTYTATGNLIGKTEGTNTQTYNFGAQQGGCSGGALSKAHAPKDMVANGSTNPLCHDANGNMTQRVEMSGTQALTYLQQWDKENRLTVVTNTATSPALITMFYYNGDGARVKKTEQNNGGAVITTTFYAGALEIISTTQTVTRTHYMAGAQLIAMREVTNTTGAGTLTYLHSDHLGSTSTTTCGNSACGLVGAVLTRQSYYPYGGVRVMGNLPTDITFTGQRSDATGLYFFQARYYSGALGRFVSADTIVPGAGNPQNLNRYSYVLNSPLNHTDPTGHCLWDACIAELAVASVLLAAVPIAIDYAVQVVGNQRYDYACSNSGCGGVGNYLMERGWKIRAIAAATNFLSLGLTTPLGAAAIVGATEVGSSVAVVDVLANAATASVSSNIAVQTTVQAGARVAANAATNGAIGVLGGAAERSLLGEDPLDRDAIASDAVWAVGSSVILKGLDEASAFSIANEQRLFDLENPRPTNLQSLLDRVQIYNIANNRPTQTNFSQYANVTSKVGELLFQALPRVVAK